MKSNAKGEAGQYLRQFTRRFIPLTNDIFYYLPPRYRTVAYTPRALTADRKQEQQPHREPQPRVYLNIIRADSPA